MIFAGEKSGQKQNLPVMSYKTLGNINKIFSSHLADFSQPGVEEGGGGVSLGESIKKEKIMTKIFLQKIFNKVKRSCKKLYLLT